MSEYEQVIEEIVKHGVAVKVSKVVDDNYISHERKYVGTVVKLDFSEHDKVFENMISMLEEEAAEWKAEAREIKKKRDEQLKSFRKAVSPYVDIGHMHETIAELKQRISDLESENKKIKCDIYKMESSKSEWIDKAFEWQQKCEKLDSKETSDLPFDALECANYLINATYERETNGIERALHNLPEKVNSDRYTVDDLEQIAEHLLVYCKHNKECEE